MMIILYIIDMAMSIIFYNILNKNSSLFYLQNLSFIGIMLYVLFLQGVLA